MNETTELRWFEKYPSCRRCGKVAHGILRGSRNESYGSHCKSCAAKRLKASEEKRKKGATHDRA